MRCPIWNPIPLLLTAALLAPGPGLAAQSVQLPGPIARPPVIDGRLDAGGGDGAARLSDCVQTDPGDNPPPSRRTEVFLAADQHTLYLAIHAYDDPALV